MSREYRKEQDDLKELKIRELEEELPPFFTQFMIAIGRSKTVNTQLNYARRIKVFLEWMVREHAETIGKDIRELSGKDLDTITFADADLYADYLHSHYIQKDGKRHLTTAKPATINAYISAVSSMYMRLYRIGVVSKNPFDGMERAKIMEEPKVRLDEIDAEKYFNTVESGEGLTEHMLSYRDRNLTGYRDFCICSVLNDTGIRVSELVGLDVDDIDIQRCRFPVIRKGGRMEYVFFSDKIKGLLMEYLENRHLYHPDENDRALFLRTQGTKHTRNSNGDITEDISSDRRLSVRSVERIVKKYAQAAGVVDASKFTPHKFRHTYATNLLKKTGNLALVQAELGHASIQSTTIYAKSDDTDRQNVRNILSD